MAGIGEWVRFPVGLCAKRPKAGRFLAVKPDETSVKAAQFIVARSAAVSTTAPALKDRVQPLWRRRRTMRSKHAIVTAVVLAVATVAVTIAPPALAGRERCDNRGRIVFTRSGDDGIPNLFSTSPCGGAVVQLTTTGAHHADISRDGRWIAYDSAAPGQSTTDVFIARADGSQARDLTNAPATNDLQPDISPEGNAIAYSTGTDRPERLQNRRPRPSLWAHDPPDAGHSGPGVLSTRAGPRPAVGSSSTCSPPVATAISG